MKTCHNGERLEFEPINGDFMCSEINNEFVAFIRDCERAFRQRGKRGVIERHSPGHAHHIHVLRHWALHDAECESCHSSKTCARDGINTRLGNALQRLIIDNWCHGIGATVKTTKKPFSGQYNLA